METNISTLKARLSATLARVKNGEEVIILDRSHPIAKIIQYSSSEKEIIIQTAQRKKFLRQFNRKIENSLERFYERESR